jgi:hypothetical protein
MWLFNALAGSGFELRRYLVLVTVPNDAERYAQCDDQSMKLSHAAYWTCLANHGLQPEGTGAARTVTVSIPKRNLLTLATLKELVRGEQHGDQT